MRHRQAGLSLPQQSSQLIPTSLFIMGFLIRACPTEFTSRNGLLAKGLVVGVGFCFLNGLQMAAASRVVFLRLELSLSTGVAGFRTEKDLLRPVLEFELPLSTNLFQVTAAACLASARNSGVCQPMVSVSDQGRVELGGWVVAKAGLSSLSV